MNDINDNIQLNDMPDLIVAIQLVMYSVEDFNYILYDYRSR